ncbi:GM15709 [Drosophila sechellia]|uniref:GM15709 n=1 Tax=Drosophila sechellia TaxID=7238 RepID=B4I7S0_DROSE|nr:GM15709 [Drosophila sechellia]
MPGSVPELRVIKRRFMGIVWDRAPPTAAIQSGPGQLAFLKSVQQQQQVLHLGANPFMVRSRSRGLRAGEMDMDTALGSASHAMGSHGHKRQATAETGIYGAFCIRSEAKVFRGDRNLAGAGGLGLGLVLAQVLVLGPGLEMETGKVFGLETLGVDKVTCQLEAKCERGGLH